MANTYVLLNSNTLGANTTSVTFSSIPQTYTDLVLKMSLRLDAGGYAYYKFNNDVSTYYSYIILTAGGGTPASYLGSNANPGYITPLGTGLPTSTYTASTFANVEMYISNYTATTSRPISIFDANENNNATTYDVSMAANLYRGTAAISSVVFTVAGGNNFVTGSSFYLYGIKNS